MKSDIYRVEGVSELVKDDSGANRGMIRQILLHPLGNDGDDEDNYCATLLGDDVYANLREYDIVRAEINFYDSYPEGKPWRQNVEVIKIENLSTRYLDE